MTNADTPARTAKVEVRLTPNEKAALAKLANDAGLSLSDYVRGEALKGETKQERRRAIPADVAELIRQLSAIGNNLNQIARACNTDGTPPIPGVMEHACGELVRVIREIAP